MADIMGNDKLIQLSVPCNGCTMCCKSAKLALVIHNPNEAQFYNTFINDSGEHEIVRKQNGECIYLRTNYCSIYEKRPTLCKEFDCRGYAIMNSVGKYDSSISEKGKLMLKRSGGLKVFAEYLSVRMNKESNESDIQNIYNELVKRKTINSLIDGAILYLEKAKSRRLYIQYIDMKVQRKLHKLNKDKNLAQDVTLCAISALCKDGGKAPHGTTFVTAIDHGLLRYLLSMQKQKGIDDLILERVVIPLAMSGQSEAIYCLRLIKNSIETSE